MKKILAIIQLSLLVFFISACNSKSETPTIPTTDRPFASRVKISYKDLSYSGLLTFRNGANASLELSEPENLKGLTFTLADNELSAKYDNIDIPLDTLDSRAKSAAGMIFKGLASAGVSSDVKVNESKNEFYVSDIIYTQKYDMTFDRKSGAIKNFIVPGEQLSVTFADFKFL